MPGPGRRGTSAGPRIRPAAILAFVPPIGLVFLLWPDPASLVPVHWGGGEADRFDSSSVLFGAALALQWPVAQLTAGEGIVRNGVGPPFLLDLIAVPLAAVAAGAAMLGHRPPSRVWPQSPEE